MLCSCTVKENRSVCPCELLVRSEFPLKTDGSVLVSVIQDGTVVRQGMMSREDFERDACTLTVPRRPSTVTVFSGITAMSAMEGKSLGIRRSYQCDEVYSTSCFAPLEADSYDCLVTLHKSYARLFLTVLALPEGARMRVSGTVDGYDLVSLEPSRGDFDCSPEPSGAPSDFLVRLPRQKDEGLCLNVIYPDGKMRSISLGAMISESGYSFDDPDLLDISLTVDLSKSYAFVHVFDWENEYYKQIDF